MLTKVLNFLRHLCSRRQSNAVKLEGSGVYPNGLSWHLSGGTKGDYCPDGPSAVHLMEQTAKYAIAFKCAHCGKEEKIMRIVIVTKDYYTAQDLEAFLRSRGHEVASQFRTYHFEAMASKYEEAAKDVNATRPLFDLVVSDGTCKDYSAPGHTTSIGIPYNYPFKWAKKNKVKVITINHLLMVKKIVERFGPVYKLRPLGI